MKSDSDKLQTAQRQALLLAHIIAEKSAHREYEAAFSAAFDRIWRMLIER